MNAARDGTAPTAKPFVNGSSSSLPIAPALAHLARHRPAALKFPDFTIGVFEAHAIEVRATFRDRDVHGNRAVAGAPMACTDAFRGFEALLIDAHVWLLVSIGRREFSEGENL